KASAIARIPMNAKQCAQRKSAPVSLPNLIGNTREPFCSEAWASERNRRSNLTSGSARVSHVGFGVSPKRTFLLDASAFEQFCCIDKIRDREDALASTRDACATRNQSVSQTHDHNSGSSSDFARFATKSPSTLDRKTAKIVEPDPDINAAPTSGCLSTHDFTCARKTNFSKTGCSRSFTKVMSPNFCD